MTDMLRELAEVVKACEDANGHRTLSDTELYLRTFIRTHHAEIAQNAEAAKRLMALEMAMGELGLNPSLAYACRAGAVQWITKRADEIMRGES